MRVYKSAEKGFKLHLHNANNVNNNNNNNIRMLWLHKYLEFGPLHVVIKKYQKQMLKNRAI